MNKRTRLLICTGAIALLLVAVYVASHFMPPAEEPAIELPCPGNIPC